MRAVKDNKVYDISKVQKEEYLSLGYDIYDDEGQLLERSPKATVPYSDYEKVVKERDELKAYAAEHGIDLGNATSKDGIIKKIKAGSTE